MIFSLKAIINFETKWKLLPQPFFFHGFRKSQEKHKYFCMVLTATGVFRTGLKLWFHNGNHILNQLGLFSWHDAFKVTSLFHFHNNDATSIKSDYPEIPLAGQLFQTLHQFHLISDIMIKANELIPLTELAGFCYNSLYKCFCFYSMGLSSAMQITD